MARSTTTTRLPRGTKIVAGAALTAFISEIDNIPAHSQREVALAAISRLKEDVLAHISAAGKGSKGKPAPKSPSKGGKKRISTRGRTTRSTRTTSRRSRKTTDQTQQAPQINGSANPTAE